MKPWLSVLILCLGALAMPTAAADLFKRAERAAAAKEVRRLQAIQQRHAAALFALPGVHAMGITADPATRTLHFGVAVDGDPADPRLPRELEGVRVAVERRARAQPADGGLACKPCHANLLPLPVEMGNSGHSVDTPGPAGGCSVCTMGFKACKLLTRDTVYVTAGHCSKAAGNSCAGSAPPGTASYHRAPGDAPMCALEGRVGSTLQQVVPACTGSDKLDAATVVSDASQTQLSVRDVGVPSAWAGSVLPWDQLQKSGRTTGWTQGIALWTSTQVTVQAPATYCCGNSVTFVDQIFIAPLGPPPVALAGDSGAGVFNMASPPEVVGLLIVAEANGAFAYANPITEVLGQLDLSLNQLDCSSPCAVTQVAGTLPDPADLLRPVREFRDTVMRRTARGRAYIDTYYRNTGAVVRLLLGEPTLLLDSARLLSQHRELLRAAVQGEPAPIGRNDVARIGDLIGRYAAAASGSLRAVFKRLQRELTDPRVLADFGITVTP